MKPKKKSEGHSRVTQDHETIKKWAEQRGGRPAVVRSTHGKQDSGLLRINFEGYSGEETLEEIEWEEFFEIFDSRNLAFLYQEKTKDGQTSRFFKLVSAAAERAGNE